MDEFLRKLTSAGLLRTINEPVSTDLEIAHLAYAEVKKDDSKALLFKTAVLGERRFKYPVLINSFCNEKALKIALSRDYEDIAEEIRSLLKMHIPKTLGAKLDFFSKLLSLKNVPPKRLKKDCLANYESVQSLEDLPILKTWEKDAAPFITMGQVYTKSLDGKENNLGMYRLQLVDDKTLLMHWQIHKDAAHFFHEYKKAGVKMPVSIAIGGDPLYIWCSQAPLPKGIFELLLYGFIKKTPAKLTKCKNGVYVPHDSDFVIEGFVDCEEYASEGPFGDHTGFYTQPSPFPVFRATHIYARKGAIFQATVVGKPPLEDKYMGLGTERIFLPLLQTTVPDLLDYHMPENGVFHNLILAKFASKYPAHAMQLMHAFWGVGQMSFVKHAIFMGEDAPAFSDTPALIKHILDRFDTKKLLISEGICDELDHASPNACYGGKAGLDASGSALAATCESTSDETLLALFKQHAPILELKQFYSHTASPIVCVLVEDNQDAKALFNELLAYKKHFKILIFLGSENHLQNPYMLVWRVVNNIDAKRDLFIKDGILGINAKAKTKADGYTRIWPAQTDCTPSVIAKLIKRGLLEDEPEFFSKFELMG